MQLRSPRPGRPVSDHAGRPGSLTRPGRSGRFRCAAGEPVHAAGGTAGKPVSLTRRRDDHEHVVGDVGREGDPVGFDLPFADRESADRKALER